MIAEGVLVARQRRGEEQRLPERIGRGAENIIGRDAGEPARDRFARRAARQRRRIGRDAERVRHEPRGIVDAAPRARLVARDEPAADGEGGNAHEHAVVDQGELGGAAADVDVEHAGAALLGQLHRAGAVGGECAFELVAGGGADELAGFRGEQFVDRLGVPALDRLAGEDHRAAIDIVALETRLAVALRDERAERGGIDGAVGEERGEHDRRAPHHLAMDDDEPARQPLGLALQQHLGEQEMRGGAADVDADGGKLDVLLVPDQSRDLGAVLVGHREMFVKDVEVVHENSAQPGPIRIGGHSAPKRCSL